MCFVQLLCDVCGVCVGFVRLLLVLCDCCKICVVC